MFMNVGQDALKRAKLKETDSPTLVLPFNCIKHQYNG